jgi:hypothetical protein
MSKPAPALISNPEIQRILQAAGIELFADVHEQQYWTTAVSQDQLAELIDQVIRSCAVIARQDALARAGLYRNFEGLVATDQAILAHFDLD